MGDKALETWVLTDLGTRNTSRGKGYATKVIEYGLSLVSNFMENHSLHSQHCHTVGRRPKPTNISRMLRVQGVIL